MTIKDFRDLRMWQAAMQLTEAVYALTRSFPPDELYGLTSQLRRAAVSVASNIAEGYARESDGELGRFLLIARGSLAEVETQLMLAERLGYVRPAAVGPAADLSDQIGRMIRGMQRVIEKKE